MIASISPPKQIYRLDVRPELELLLVANAIQLFMAGYETTSTIMAVCLYVWKEQKHSLLLLLLL
ncbi:MAG: hypothetical protein AAGB01_10895, partial [Cyanobacteria bacterium P01_F01_bin.42]